MTTAPSNVRLSGWCAAEYHRACPGILDTAPESCECQRCDHDRFETEAVHAFFGLTYSNYLVLHRTLMQSMPEDWQRQLVTLLEQLRAAYGHLDLPGDYEVQVVEMDEEMFCSQFTDNQDCGDDCPDACGEFRRATRPVQDPVPHYQRGRARVEPQLAGLAGLGC